MPKVTSSRQLAANRKNAQKSTGPKTKSGKSKAAANSIKHGLLARTIALAASRTGESMLEFNQLVTNLMRELKPTSLIERTLVERIATCLWRLARAHRVEAGLISEGRKTRLTSANLSRECANRSLKPKKRSRSTGNSITC